MDGFIELLSKLVIEAGVERGHIYYRESLELPGYFRPTKQWDCLVVVKGHLVAALEAKSQVGPSFGNNFNNRTEEAMGSALDLWTAFRENAFGTGSNHGLVTCSFSMIVRNHVPPSEVKNHISKSSRSSETPPMPSVTNSSAAASFWSAITTPRRFSSPAPKPGSKAITWSRQRI